MSERVSLIEIYSALRDNNISSPVATAVATATYRFLTEDRPKPERSLAAALRSNAGFATLTLLVTVIGLAVVHLLTLR